MKFAHQIQFNAVPDWTDYYVPYAKLKKLIYVIEKDKGALQSSPDEELAATDQTPLLNNHRYAVDNVMEASNRRFLDALNKALNNIVAFYSRKETELYDDMDQLLFDYDRLNTLHAHDSLTLATQPSAIPSPEHKRHSTALQKRTVDLFVMLSELKTYVTLNHTAFSKILKKYDKITDNVLKPYYLTSYVDCAFPFKATTRARLDERIQETEHGYVLLVTTDDVTEEFAMAELKMHLREHVIWERNTVWRDLVALERKKQTVELAAQRTWGYWQWFHGFFLAAALLVFALLLSVDLFGQVEQNRCFAILVFISMLWAGKVMPLFVTALMIPFLVVTLRVLRSDDGYRLDAPAATRSLFAAMFSPVLMLLVGAFTLTAALSKYGITKTVAAFVVSRTGTRPSRVLLAHMFVATVTSMWTSNVAAPILCYSLIQPILRTLPPDTRFAPCLILGIAFASTLGGIASPISSPQNIIAIQYMSPAPTWGEWLLVSLPLCVAGDGILWLWLIWSYAPEHQLTHIHPLRSTSDPITWMQIYICLVTVGTILLWFLTPSFAAFFGDMGVVAIVPIVAFFGPGILTKDDFNTFAWSVVMLAMGGIALGQAMESSGLALTLVGSIQPSGPLVHGVLILILATFIGPTSAASVVMPIIAKMDQPRSLVMGAAFICSCAMGLPISGFSNMYAVAQESELGKVYLSTKDFVRNGVPCSALTTLCVTTLGYLLMKGIGF